MEGSPYSPLKVLHHRERIDSIKAGKQIVPTQVQLIISDLCNQDCSFCAYRMSGYTSNQLFAGDSELAQVGTNNPKRMIETPKVMEILNDCYEMGVGAIQVTGGGEPTVHPDHIEIFNAISDRGMGLGVVSNGAVFRKGLIEAYLRGQWVRFSIDAGNEDTYSGIRRVAKTHFHRTWKNIDDLCAAKRENPDSDLIIGIGFVVTKDNWKEILDCTVRAKEAGVDNVRISAIFQDEGISYFDGFYDEAKEIIREASRLSDESFKVFNNFGDRTEDLELQNPEYSYCGYQEFNTYIGGDLNVYRCCVLAYNERGIVGSLKNQRFKELWDSEMKKRNFDEFDAKGCPRCMFNNKNRTILYAIEPAPRHVDFV
jgi:MoaA/NifB/PqqE/SkfB family radical SAM enzyme